MAKKVAALVSESPELHETVVIPVGELELRGNLVVPEHATGLVVFAHGHGSSRLSPRNRSVARTLNESGLATLLIDLLDTQEDESDRQRLLRSNIEHLADRVVQIIDWLVAYPETQGLKIGIFGASTGAAAAIVAAGRRDKFVSAVVSRGGRPDLAADSLKDLQAPILFIVGGADTEVIEHTKEAQKKITCTHKLAEVADAKHLFEEPGALDQVTTLANEWFTKHLK